jgi:hypothetical protein
MAKQQSIEIRIAIITTIENPSITANEHSMIVAGQIASNPKKETTSIFRINLLERVFGVLATTAGGFFGALFNHVAQSQTIMLIRVLVQCCGLCTPIFLILWMCSYYRKIGPHW